MTTFRQTARHGSMPLTPYAYKLRESSSYPVALKTVLLDDTWSGWRTSRRCPPQLVAFAGVGEAAAYSAVLSWSLFSYVHPRCCYRLLAGATARPQRATRSLCACYRFEGPSLRCAKRQVRHFSVDALRQAHFCAQLARGAPIRQVRKLAVVVTAQCHGLHFLCAPSICSTRTHTVPTACSRSHVLTPIALICVGSGQPGTLGGPPNNSPNLLQAILRYPSCQKTCGSSPQSFYL